MLEYILYLSVAALLFYTYNLTQVVKNLRTEICLISTQIKTIKGAKMPYSDSRKVTIVKDFQNSTDENVDIDITKLRNRK